MLMVLVLQLIRSARKVWGMRPVPQMRSEDRFRDDRLR